MTIDALPANRRTWRITLLVLVLLAAWAIYAWMQLRPAEIAADWHGWRQTDTQTIALNFTKPESGILKPQISWGGDGPGYVETELQLYTWMISWLLQLFGPVEWAGQLISLLAMCGAACVVFAHLSRQYLPVAALVGFGAFLAARLPAHMATVVMPDALALLAYVGAWTFFTRYASQGRTRDLVAYGVIGALAMLIKPTTAHLGISSFLLLLLAHRARLSDYRLWITWTSMVAAFGLYLAHAHQLYAEYGNTFGLLAGEDSKTPHLRHLLDPALYVATARYAIMWGLGPIAALVLVIQVLRLKLTAEQVSLLAGNIVIVFIALRYMSDGAGVHYFAPILLLVASVIAQLTNELLKAGSWRYVAVAVLGMLLVGQGYRNAMIRHHFARSYTDDTSIVAPGELVAAGKAMAGLRQQDDLVIVRSAATTFDSNWERVATHHDPRIFYVSGTRGWTLGRDQDDPQLVIAFSARGARFLIDPLIQRAPQLDAWLAAHAELAWAGAGGGRIWRLNSSAAN